MRPFQLQLCPDGVHLLGFFLEIVFLSFLFFTILMVLFLFLMLVVDVFRLIFFFFFRFYCSAQSLSISSTDEEGKFMRDHSFLSFRGIREHPMNELFTRNG